MNITLKNLFDMYCQEYITPEKYEELCKSKGAYIGYKYMNKYVWFDEPEFNKNKEDFFDNTILSVLNCTYFDDPNLKFIKII